LSADRGLCPAVCDSPAASCASSSSWSSALAGFAEGLAVGLDAFVVASAAFFATASFAACNTSFVASACSINAARVSR